MIARPTALILGAGASASFGFETGSGLLSSVLTNVGVSPEHVYYKFLEPRTATELQDFREALRKSGRMSVDAFLEHRPEFTGIGKRAIALTLIQREAEDSLFKRDVGNWYEYLFNRLNTRFSDFGKNQLRILTFNYDRSLEHYLLTAMVNAYGKPVAECAEMLKIIPILHLHGDLGGLPYLEKEQVRAYTPKLDPFSIQIAANRIRIIHENTTNDPIFAEAHKILASSEVIRFLGFGYHPLNMERLGFKVVNRHDAHPGKTISGTSFGLTNTESGELSHMYGIPLRPSPSVFDYRKLDVLQYLRETTLL